MKTTTNLRYLLIFLGLVAFYACEPDQVLYTTNQVFSEEDRIIKKPLKINSWVISDFSSEEASGEGDTGLASDLIDSSLDTYWHSCWTCDPAGEHPHYITIDMGDESEIAGLYIAQRQSLSRAVKAISIELSSDSSTWTSAGNFDLENTATLQEVDFGENKTARYIKVTINSSYDGSIYAALAQIHAYKHI